MLLSEFLPDFTVELRDAMNSAGEHALASQIEVATLVSCSYDSGCKAGYIRVEAGRVLNTAEHFAMQVRHGRTLALEHTYLVNVDVDNFERVTGVELLNAQELAVKLSMPVD